MRNTIEDQAKKIIKENQYMTIASSDENGKSWASPVAYVFYDKFNFYWVSVPESQHQRNMKHNPEITIAIFDWHQLWSEGWGCKWKQQLPKFLLKIYLELRNYTFLETTHMATLGALLVKD